MKIKKHIVTVAVLCIAICATMSADLFGTQGSIMFPIGWSIEAVSPIRVGVPIQYALIVKQEEEHNRPATGATVSVSIIGKLQFEGRRNLEVSFKDRLADTLSFEVVLPANDTSGFIIEIRGKGKRPVNLYAIRTYVTTGDSVEVYGDDVRLHPPKSKPRNYGSAVQGIPGTPLTEEEMRIARSGPHSIPENARELALKSQPNQTSMGIPDSVIIDSLRKVKEEGKLEEKRRKELTPLLTLTSEHIQVGDTVYVRRRGQRKFRPTVSAKELRERSQRGLDSLKALPDDALVELLVKAPDTASLKTLDGVSTNRTATAIPGTYRVWIRKGKIDSFHELGLGFELMLLRPYDPPDSAEPTKQIDSSIELNKSPSQMSTQEVIFSESFSGSWPGPI